MIKANNSIKVLDDIEGLLEVSDISLTVSGSSMWPFFKTGKTKTKLTKIKKIKKGNIYLFKKNDTYVLHRLIKIDDNYLTFRGDGNVKKEIVSKESLIAELVSYKNNDNKEILITKKSYKFKVFLYRLLPRRIVIKLFKRRKWQINSY